MKKVSNRLYLARKIFDYTVVLILILLLLFIWQLYRGPIAVPFLKPYIIDPTNLSKQNGWPPGHKYRVYGRYSFFR